MEGEIEWVAVVSPKDRTFQFWSMSEDIQGKLECHKGAR